MQSYGYSAYSLQYMSTEYSELKQDGCDTGHRAVAKLAKRVI